MAQRTKSPAITVRLLREGIIESVHHVQAVVCDSRGRVLSVAGDLVRWAIIKLIDNW